MGDTWWDRHVLLLRILGFHTIQVMCRCCGDEELRAIGVRASLGREDRSPGDPTDDPDLVTLGVEKKKSARRHSPCWVIHLDCEAHQTSVIHRETPRVGNLGLAEQYIMRQGMK